jgi:hypothetical protein
MIRRMVTVAFLWQIMGPSGFFVDLLGFSFKENHRAR